jgi:molybdopterin-containing oxidoreductase family molybdopterin binding subunit
VKPLFRAPPWVDVLIELAERVGFLEDFNVMLAKSLSTRCRTPIRLDPHRKYSLEELSDIWLKAEFGDETKGLAWFQQHGQLKVKRTVREAFPMLDMQPRIPLYYEHFLTAGDRVQKVTREMHLPWDTSDYQPLPDWKPCPAFESKTRDYDLFVVNYTIPFHQYSITAENPWLNEISERHPSVYKIMVNRETARERGIQDGATICIETMGGRKVTGRAKVSECIHPEVVGIAGVFGAWCEGKPIARGKGVHFNSLIPFDLDHMDMISGSADGCERVRVYPAKLPGRP